MTKTVRRREGGREGGREEEREGGSGGGENMKEEYIQKEKRSVKCVAKKEEWRREREGKSDNLHTATSKPIHVIAECLSVRQVIRHRMSGIVSMYVCICHA